MSEEQKISSELWFADKIAKFSKDTSTKVGAAIFNESETTPLSYGYNGMPRGLDDDNIIRNTRPEKYFWYEHAERNAIYNVARNILNKKIIFCSHFPNMEGGRGIVCSGIKSVIVDNACVDTNDKETQRVIELFNETGVKLITPDLKNFKENFKDFCDFNKFNTINIEENLSYKKVHSKLKKYNNYLNLVKDYGMEFSPDRVKKAGCLILDENTYTPIATGVNSPPPIFKLTEAMHNEEKSFWFQEAEKNAIFSAVTPLLKNSHFKVSWCPCVKCSLAIISVKASKVTTRKPDFTNESDLRWKVQFEQSQKMFALSNIELEFIKEPVLIKEKIKAIKI